MPGAHGHLSVRDYGASHGSHDHEHFQILVGLEGVLELEVAGRGQRIAAGGGCVVPPGEHHDFEGRGATRCLVLDSHDPAWARAVAAAPPGVHVLARYLAAAITAGPGDHNHLAVMSGLDGLDDVGGVATGGDGQ